MQRGKPILVLPREAARDETRNDHQIATARAFAGFDGVLVAWTDDEVRAQLDDLVTRTADAPTLAETARGPLIERVARFIDDA